MHLKSIITAKMEECPCHHPLKMASLSTYTMIVTPTTSIASMASWEFTWSETKQNFVDKKSRTIRDFVILLVRGIPLLPHSVHAQIGAKSSGLKDSRSQLPNEIPFDIWCPISNANPDLRAPEDARNEPKMQIIEFKHLISCVGGQSHNNTNPLVRKTVDLQDVVVNTSLWDIIRFWNQIPESLTPKT